MISSRFGVAVSILLALAIVPTVIHGYVGARADDGLVTGTIDTTLGGLTSEPTRRRAAWVTEIFDSDDWIERRYRAPDGAEALLFVARSYDLKRLYHHPELAVLYGIDLKEGGTVPLPGMPDVPVHLLTNRIENRNGLGAYTLLYDGRFIENPIALQLRTSWELLFTPRRPMTLFLVYDRDLPPVASFQESPGAIVLEGAIHSFLSQVPSSPTSGTDP